MLVLKPASDPADARARRRCVVPLPGNALKVIPLLLVMWLCGWQPTAAGQAVTRDQVATQESDAPVTVPGTTALEMEAEAFARNFTNHVRAATQEAGGGKADSQTLVLGLVGVVVGLLVLGKLGLKLAEYVNNQHDPWAARSPSKAETVDEEKSFSEFAAKFTAGPAATSAQATASATAANPAPAPVAVALPKPQAVPKTEQIDPAVGAHSLFLENSGKRLALIRKLFSEVGRAPSHAARQRILSELLDVLRLLKGEADLPQTVPVWQMASAAEGLLEQLAARAHNVTPSTLRTLAGAIDLLHGLRRRGPSPDLITNPPVRVLVVDDDAISRRAVAFSIQKVFSAPDQAPDGEAALALAEANEYEVVFLDVQMPGMDGFELCSRIHGTLSNATTPVVFVTCRSDFEARAKSSVLGGQDLLAKPFLSFELTVKALTLVMRRRMEAQGLKLGFETAWITRDQVEATEKTAAKSGTKEKVVATAETQEKSATKTDAKEKVAARNEPEEKTPAKADVPEKFVASTEAMDKATAKNGSKEKPATKTDSKEQVVVRTEPTDKVVAKSESKQKARAKTNGKSKAAARTESAEVAA